MRRESHSVAKLIRDSLHSVLDRGRSKSITSYFEKKKKKTILCSLIDKFHFYNVEIIAKC